MHLVSMMFLIGNLLRVMGLENSSAISHHVLEITRFAEIDVNFTRSSEMIEIRNESKQILWIYCGNKKCKKNLIAFPR